MALTVEKSGFKGELQSCDRPWKLHGEKLSILMIQMNFTLQFWTQSHNFQAHRLYKYTTTLVCVKGLFQWPSTHVKEL